jgi:hypothetical protein
MLNSFNPPELSFDPRKFRMTGSMAFDTASNYSNGRKNRIPKIPVSLVLNFGIKPESV